MKKKIIILVIGLSAICLIAYSVLFSCSVSDEEAIRLTKEFCNKHGIDCENEHSVRTLPSVLPALTGGGISKAFDRYKKLSVSNKILFSVGCRGKEITSYYNSKIVKDVTSKYRSIVKSEGYPAAFHMYWPEIISEKKAMEIVDSIAARIGIPEDMIFSQLTRTTDFNKISKNGDQGFWLARWVRKRNGYQYEADRIEIGIMGATGDFVSYLKVYEGSDCSTVAKISKEKATVVAWNNLRKIIGEKAWRNLRGRYSITSLKPLIVQPNVCFGRACSYKSKKSRLAWVINFAVKVRQSYGKMAVDESLQHTKNILKLWEEMGKPPIAVDIRIDAESGKYLGGHAQNQPWN